MYDNIKAKSISLHSNLCVFSNSTYSNTATNKFLSIPHRASPILASYYENQIQFRPICNTSMLLSEKSCPKIKGAIEAAKLQCQKQNTVNSVNCGVVQKPKKSIKQKIIDELKHYYYGFKLLGLNTKISFKLAIKKMRGIELTRRENNLVSFL